MNKNIIQIRNVSKSYNGVKINNNISIDIKENEVHCIAGLNGSGKTTLIKQIVGIIKSDEGEILFNNDPINRDKNIVGNYVSYQPQNISSIFRGLKVHEAIYYIGILKGLPKKKCRDELNQLLSLFELYNIRNKLLSYLSGGEKQLVSLLMTLIGNNPILIFDEPTNNLDLERKEIFIKELIRRKRYYNNTILVVTHDLTEFEGIIDTISILYNGKLAITENPYNIFTDSNDKVKIIIRNINDIDQQLIREFANGYVLKKDGKDYCFIINKDDLEILLGKYKQIYIDEFNIELSHISLQDKFLNFISKFNKC